jgi:hypothetical protein
MGLFNMTCVCSEIFLIISTSVSHVKSVNSLMNVSIYLSACHCRMDSFTSIILKVTGSYPGPWVCYKNFLVQPLSTFSVSFKEMVFSHFLMLVI